MKGLNNSGFTIIETTLFLAISGALIGALIVGTWSSINYQRYRDSVTSLESLIKQQYSDVENIVNGRPAAASCGANGAVSTNRGQSDCMMLGRYLKINSNGDISISTVAGYRSDASIASDEIDALKNKYTLFLLDSSTESSQLEWGAKIAWPSSGLGWQTPTIPRTIAFLFLHSPTSSLIYTFSSTNLNISLNGNDGIINSDTNSDPGRGVRNICVDSGDGFNRGLSVWVDAMAFDSSAVQIHSNDMNRDSLYEINSEFWKDPPKC
jgi:type II secretory pathway pseudopilin PulG